MTGRAGEVVPGPVAVDDLEHALAVEHDALKAGLVLAHEWLAAASGAGTLGWWEWLADLDALTWDDAFETLFGLTAEHGFAPLATLIDRVQPEDRPRLADAFADTRAGDGTAMVRVRVPAEEGSRTVVLCGRRYRHGDPGHTRIAGIAVGMP